MTLFTQGSRSDKTSSSRRQNSDSIWQDSEWKAKGRGLGWGRHDSTPEAQGCHSHKRRYANKGRLNRLTRPKSYWNGNLQRWASKALRKAVHFILKSQLRVDNHEEIWLDNRVGQHSSAVWTLLSLCATLPCLGQGSSGVSLGADFIKASQNFLWSTATQKGRGMLEQYF